MASHNLAYSLTYYLINQFASSPMSVNNTTLALERWEPTANLVFDEVFEFEMKCSVKFKTSGKLMVDLQESITKKKSLN